ncbi:hypothetical protein [Dendronalium sp. ChiSLP03b]|nr:hypothetical protein [Dendronalium sp. ChiSLP03b]
MSPLVMRLETGYLSSSVTDKGGLFAYFSGRDRTYFRLLYNSNLKK